MSKTFVAQACNVAQQHGVTVFPAGADKRPLIKDWPNEAAIEDPDIERLFSIPGAKLIGVSMKPNGLICFDLDYGHTDDPDRHARLQAFEDELLAAYPGGVRVHRTPSGGKHMIMDDRAVTSAPGAIMPKLDVRWNAYIAWACPGTGYEVEIDVPLSGLASPGAEFLQVRERREGYSGEHLPTLSEADHILRSNGSDGQRHDALLRLALDWVEKADDIDNVFFLAESFEAHLRFWYKDCIDPDRLEKLVEWRYDPSRDQWDGELGRALAGPLKRRQKDARFAEILREEAERLRPFVEAQRQAKVEADAASLFIPYNPSDEVRLQPWVITGICRKGDIGGFSGIPGLGKTNLSAVIAAALASGDGAAAGLPPLGGAYTVAWANAEESRDTLHMRLMAACDELGIELTKQVLIAGYEQLAGGGADFLIPKPGASQQMVYDEAVVERWVLSLKTTGAEVLIIDPLTEFNTGNENDRGHRLQLMRGLRKVCSEVGMTLIYWAHTGKAPENKRADWYDGDLYAERGSSGGIGTNAFGGTLVRMYPKGMKAADSHAWDRNATDPSHDVPNLIKMSIVKNKIAAAKPVMYWELKPSSKVYDGDTIPVCVPVDEVTARLRIDQAYYSVEQLDMVQEVSRAIVREFGVGDHHSLTALHDKMRELQIAGWPTVDNLRADKGQGAEMIAKWSAPVPAVVDGVMYTVQMSKTGNGSTHTRFTIAVRAV